MLSFVAPDFFAVFQFLFNFSNLIWIPLLLQVKRYMPFYLFQYLSTLLLFVHSLLLLSLIALTISPFFVAAHRYLFETVYFVYPAVQLEFKALHFYLVMLQEDPAFAAYNDPAATFTPTLYAYHYLLIVEAQLAVSEFSPVLVDLSLT